MTRKEAKEVLGDVRAYLACRAILENEILAGHTFTDICNAIKTLEQEPFINKDCVSKGACHEDKIRVLDKITTEMEQLTVTVDTNHNQYVSKNDVINIINKYMTERNDKE